MNTTLIVPLLAEEGSLAKICQIHVLPGQSIARGAALLDVSITLGGGAAHDCPPVTYFRLHTREAATLLEWHVSVGDTVLPGSTLAHLACAADVAAPGTARSLRLMVAGIVPEYEF